MYDILDTTLSTCELDGLFKSLSTDARVELLKCLKPISQAAVVYSLHNDEERHEMFAAVRLNEGLRATLRVGLEEYDRYLAKSKAALMRDIETACGFL